MKTSYTPAFKARLVQELLTETKTISQLATEHGVHPNVLREWRATARHGLPSLFEKGDSVATLRTADEQQIEDLYAQIGRLTTQVAWLKKTPPVAYDIPAGEQRLRLPIVAHAPTIGYSIPKIRPTNLLVCGQSTSDQNP